MIIDFLILCVSESISPHRPTKDRAVNHPACTSIKCRTRTSFTTLIARRCENKGLLGKSKKSQSLFNLKLPCSTLPVELVRYLLFVRLVQSYFIMLMKLMHQVTASEFAANCSRTLVQYYEVICIVF